MDEHKQFETDEEIYTFLRKISYCAKQFVPYVEEQNEEADLEGQEEEVVIHEEYGDQENEGN
jgi:hypothetical protein